MTNDELHVLETSKALAALALMVFWAVGLSLVDAHLYLGVAVGSLGILSTIWLFWKQFKISHLAEIKTWPWLAVIILLIQAGSLGYLFLTRNSDAEEKPRPVIQQPIVSSSPGSIIAPSGGTNSITNNFSYTPRVELKNDLKIQLLARVPHVRPVVVFFEKGDAVSEKLAHLIADFLRTSGYREPRVQWEVSDVPPREVHIELHSENDTYTSVIVGPKG